MSDDGSTNVCKSTVRAHSWIDDEAFTRLRLITLDAPEQRLIDKSVTTTPVLRFDKDESLTWPPIAVISSVLYVYPAGVTIRTRTTLD